MGPSIKIDISVSDKSLKESNKTIESLGTTAKKTGGTVEKELDTSFKDGSKKAVNSLKDIDKQSEVTRASMVYLADSAAKMGEGVVKFMTPIIQAGIDLEDSLGRAKTTWKDYFDEVEKGFDKYQGKMSKQSYMDLITQIGSKGKANGLSEAEAYSVAQRQVDAAMKISNSTGKGLTSTLDSLQKAFIGNTMSLEDYTKGVYQDSKGLQQMAREAGIAEATIKAGTYSMEDQAKMAEAAAKKIGQDNPAKTMKLSMEEFQNISQDIIGEIGTEMIPMLQPVLDFAKDILGWLKNMSPETKNLIGKIALVVTTVGLAATGVGKVMGVVQTFKPVLETVGKVLGLGGGAGGLLKGVGIIGAIMVAIELFTWMYDTFPWFQDLVKTVFGAIAEYIGWAIDNLKKLIEWVKRVIEWFKELGNKIADVFNNGAVQDYANAYQDTNNMFIHRTGISYVPTDGYFAQLHRGERVLTAEENRRYTKGQDASGQSTNVTNNITINAPTDTSAVKAYISLKDKLRREQYGLAVN